MFFLVHRNNYIPYNTIIRLHFRFINTECGHNSTVYILYRMKSSESRIQYRLMFESWIIKVHNIPYT